MLAQFNCFIKEKLPGTEKKFILLAVSGGKDSVTMTHLFHEAGLAFGIAHCNFKLRGEESDQDEQFVKELALHYNVPFFSKRFETGDFAQERHISIQMAARELRYQWFEELREEHCYDLIATAHHLNDAIETLLMNLIRGTGISGLHGIAIKRDCLIRPMLFARAEEIETYVTENKLAYREDSSNLEEYYLRNKIRLQLIPVLKDLNPELDRVMQKNMERFADLEALLHQFREEKEQELIYEENGLICIRIDPLRKISGVRTLLFELLKPYGFTEGLIPGIFDAIDARSGTSFHAPEWTLTKDRGLFVLSPVHHAVKEEIPIHKDTDAVLLPGGKKISIRRASAGSFAIPSSKRIACLDEDLLKFPLLLRSWETGDVFYPFGMKGQKKLSDFFIDEKIPLPQKNNIPVVLSAGKIVWVAGMRTDNRFRITESTKKIYILELESD